MLVKESRYRGGMALKKQTPPFRAAFAVLPANRPHGLTSCTV
jgi:hypothetical protein